METHGSSTTPSPSTTRDADVSRLVLAAGAALLLISLFLNWYGFDGVPEGVSAWTAFEVADLLLALIALAAILAAVEPLARVSLPSLPPKLIPLAGAASFLLVAVSLVDKPPAVQGAELEVGAWLALAGSVVMLAAGLLSTNRVSLVISPRESASRPQIDPLPGRNAGEETKTQRLPRS